jgi:two-component sensor histidine kinase/HAMP domain-containing protein
VGVKDRVLLAGHTIAYLSLLIFLIGAVSVFFISSAMTTPLKNMLSAVEEIARGNLERRVSVGSRDEFSQLGLSFNSMVEHLHDAQIHLEDANISLKSKAGELQLEINERIRAEEQVKGSLQEKEVLLKEIHHRVKNNMQVISSLLNLQSGYVSNLQDLVLFRESQNRVKSMALIHEKLYRSESLARIDFGEYVRDLSRTIIRTYNPTGVVLEIDVEGIFLGVDTAIPCGLIINELVSNSLKYAFPGEGRGRVFIQMASQQEGEVVLFAGDDGIGLPSDIDFRKSNTLGLQLVFMLTQQLGGTIELQSEQGAAFKIVFPYSDHSADGHQRVASPSSTVDGKVQP